MKLYRSALLAGLLAFGVAACDDDVAVVAPTAPAPPPVTATMAPASATVAVGNNVVFAVSASGGVAGESATWTCSSSSTDIATVSSTSAGCQATGVVAGSLTVTAAVSKSGQTVNVGAELTVVSDVLPPATAIVTIYSILNTAGQPAVPPISGRVNVVFNLDRGNSNLYGLDLLVDGESVAHQSFRSSGMGGMAAPVDDDAAAEQAAALFQTILSLDTHAYDVVDGVGIPNFPNGDHVVSARLTLAGADMMAGETVPSNEITVAFENKDRYNMTLTADGNQAMDDDGLIWAAGSVTATAIPVIFSGGDVVSQIEFELQDVSEKTRVVLKPEDPEDTETEKEVTYVASITDKEAPFEVTWPNDSSVADDLPISDDAHVEGLEPGGMVVVISNSAFADGSVGPTTPVAPVGSDPADKSHFVRLDNAGPSISNLHRAMQFNKHYAITNWVGADHAFTFSSSSSSTPDFSDGGVGRDRGDHEYSAGASTSNVSAVSTPNDLDESSNDRQYVLRAMVRDRLGNETVRWWAGADDAEGQSNSDSDRRDVDDTDDFKFGVDLTTPTQVLLDEDDGAYIGIGDLGVIKNMASGVRRMIRLEYDDPGNGAGFDGSSVPVHSRIVRYAPGVTGSAACVVGFWYSDTGACEILGQSGSHQSPMRGGTVGEYDFMDDGDGYYSVEYAVMDDAGNRADFITAEGIIDEVEPTASVLAPAMREAGEGTTFSAFVSDNLDLAWVDGFIVVGTEAYQQTSEESVGSPSLPFEQSTTVTSPIENLPAGIGATDINGYFVRVVDQAGNPGYDQNTFAPDRVAVDIMEGDRDTDTPGRVIDYDAVAVRVTMGDPNHLCWDTDDDGCNDNAKTRTSVTFTIEAEEKLSMPEGEVEPESDITALETPFERVAFYVQVRNPDGTVVNPPGTEATTMWVELGEGRGRAPTEKPETEEVVRQFSWSLSVSAEDLGMALGLVAPPTTADTEMNIRAVGYTEEGDAVMITSTGGQGITLSLQGPSS